MICPASERRPYLTNQGRASREPAIPGLIPTYPTCLTSSNRGTWIDRQERGGDTRPRSLGNWGAEQGRPGTRTCIRALSSLSASPRCGVTCEDNSLTSALDCCPRRIAGRGPRWTTQYVDVFEDRRPFAPGGDDEDARDEDRDGGAGDERNEDLSHPRASVGASCEGASTVLGKAQAQGSRFEVCTPSGTPRTRTADRTEARQ